MPACARHSALTPTPGTLLSGARGVPSLTVGARFSYGRALGVANLPPAGPGFGGISLAHNVGSKALVDAVLAVRR